MTSYERHELNLMPDMTAAEYAGLMASIKASGQIHPIMLYQGKILDGWQRYRACVELGLEVTAEAFEGDDEAALAYGRSMNLVRAAYTPDQLAAITAEIELLLEARRPQQQSLFEGA